MEFLFKGIVLGFSVAAPVGPIGVLCINRTINKNFAAGFVSGLGAATADLIYGLIAGLGLTAVSAFLIHQSTWIQLFGLLFLVYIGCKTITREKKEIQFSPVKNKGLLMDYVTTLVLTITNPLTILFFIAVFAGLGLSDSLNGYLPIAQLVTGVFAGSCIWWLFLSGLTVKVKKNMNQHLLKKIDLVSGVIILIFAAMILFNLMRGIIQPG
ncbi:LysE family transporter [Balneolaceae bacterium ANBcel3]|nr:LysE family transporter [Balneolaceae bacterium ANBcel3]